MLPYGPVLSEHCVRVAGLDPGRNPRAAPLGDGEQAALLQGVRSWEAWLDACENTAAARQWIARVQENVGTTSIQAGEP